MAPTREPVDSMWLSSYQLDLLEEYHLTKISKCSKLLQTLYDMKDYTLHYVTLKIYERNGLKVSKLHKVLKFRQSKWMAKYIELNTRLRQAATGRIAENFFKLINNSVFGKCCESMRNRFNAFLVRDERALLNHTDKFNMKSFKIFDENMAVVTTRKTKINLVKPTIVGASILDLSKAFMFRFHYKNMKQWFKCELLYSDMDSLTYSVGCDDLYEELARAEVSTEFDFSNYASDSALYNTENYMVTLKYKGELAGVVMEKFCGLKPKMY